MVEVIHAAFGARPPLDPPSTAIAETPASVAASLGQRRRHLRRGRRPPGRRHPGPAGAGPGSPRCTGSRCTRTSSGTASPRPWSPPPKSWPRRRATRPVELFARDEFAELIAFWQHRGFAVDRAGSVRRDLDQAAAGGDQVPTADAMQALGDAARPAAATRRPDHRLRRPRGRQDHTHPRHRPRPGQRRTDHLADLRALPGTPLDHGPAHLVHVDAYRLTSPAELDDLDLDATLADAVTVVEWGQGIAEGLAPRPAGGRHLLAGRPGTDDGIRIVMHRGRRAPLGRAST